MPGLRPSPESVAVVEGGAATVKCTVPLVLMEKVPTAVPGVLALPGVKRNRASVAVLSVMPLTLLASIVGLKNANDMFAALLVAFAPPG